MQAAMMFGTIKILKREIFIEKYFRVLQSITKFEKMSSRIGIKQKAVENRRIFSRIADSPEE